MKEYLLQNFGDYPSAKELLDQMYSRQLFVDDCYSPVNMTPDEQRVSVIEDILMITVFELQSGVSLSFDRAELFRFCQELQPMLTPVLDELINTGVVSEIEGQLRISGGIEGIKLVMPVTTVHYHGFDIQMPDGYITINRELAKEVDIDDHAAFLSVEIDALKNGRVPQQFVEGKSLLS